MKNQMLNGRFSRWLSRQINKVIDYAADYVNTVTFGIIKEVVNKVSQAAQAEVTNSLQREGATEPTPEEEAILNVFTNKFKVFVTSIFVNLQSANNNIDAVNAILKKINIAKQYFSNNETKGLSSNVIDLRMQLITQMFSAIEETLNNYAGDRFLSNTNVIANQADFGLLFLNNISGQNFTVPQYVNSSTSLLPNPVNNSSNSNAGVVSGSTPVRGSLQINPAYLPTLPSASSATTNPPTPIIKATVISVPVPKTKGSTITTTPQPTATVPSIAVGEMDYIKLLDGPIKTPPAPIPMNSPPLIAIQTAIVKDKDGVIPGANIAINGTNYTPTDINGSFTLKNIFSTTPITISFVGYKTITILSANLPKYIILEKDENVLNEVVVKSFNSKTSWLWIIAVLGLVYGGYRYSVNSKTNKIIKTKI